MSYSYLIVGYLDAAAKILAREGKPMKSSEIIAECIAKGLISPRGKTPSASLRSSVYRNMKSAGKESVFTIVDRKIALKSWKSQ